MNHSSINIYSVTQAYKWSDFKTILDRMHPSFPTPDEEVGAQDEAAISFLEGTANERVKVSPTSLLKSSINSYAASSMESNDQGISRCFFCNKVATTLHSAIPSSCMHFSFEHVCFLVIS